MCSRPRRQRPTILTSGAPADGRPVGTPPPRSVLPRRRHRRRYALRRAGLRPRIDLAQGEASAAIIASARRIDADLIVLGHRQRSLFERLFDPSVAQHVLDRTRCSVLIARAG